MPEIRLPTGIWPYDEQDMLGPPGGFGAVFRGQGADREAVAVKRLQSAYQTREMRIADFLLGHGLAHVIPIFDAGFDADAGTNFIIMPIAEPACRCPMFTGRASGPTCGLSSSHSVSTKITRPRAVIWWPKTHGRSPRSSWMGSLSVGSKCSRNSRWTITPPARGFFRASSPARRFRPRSSSITRERPSERAQTLQRRRRLGYSSPHPPWAAKLLPLDRPGTMPYARF